jgi:hypothetical protein
MSKYLGILGSILPLPNSDKADSVLAAEVEGCRVLLKQLDPRTTRVGIVSFNGDADAMTPDAITEVPLTSDFTKVERGLDTIYRNGPKGMTNMVAAVNLATIELLGTASAYSEKREGARRVIMFLTDGQPTLRSRTLSCRTPRWRSSKRCAGEVRHPHRHLRDRRGGALRAVVVAEMARVSNGAFTPVRNPKDLRAIFEDVRSRRSRSSRCATRPPARWRSTWCPTRTARSLRCSR